MKSSTTHEILKGLMWGFGDLNEGDSVNARFSVTFLMVFAEY